MRDFLSNDGYQIIQEFAGDKGLEAMENMEPDLVILDIMLLGLAQLNMLFGMSKGDRESEMIIYSAPFIQNNSQVGSIYVSVPYHLVRESGVFIYVVSGLLIVCILACMISLITLIFKDILKPIREIHKVTNRIREGHLEDCLTCAYDGEIGMLCHDF